MNEAISIRYEGGDAVEHAIDLNQLGVSLQGFARILAVCGNFVETGKYNKQFDSLSVKVIAKEPDQHHCYEVVAYVQSILTSANFWSGTGGAALSAIVAYVLSRRSGEEMKHLKDALDLAIGQNASINEKLIATIDKMAEALRPAARNATYPIGRTCQRVDLYSGNSRIANLDQSSQDGFSQNSGNEITATKKWVGLISELDVRTGTCKVSLGDSDSRVQAEITDPIRMVPNNPYALALAAQVKIEFLAKAEVDEDREIVKLYISDLAPSDQPPAPA
jgi:hypothetical protein